MATEDLNKPNIQEALQKKMSRRGFIQFAAGLAGIGATAAAGIAINKDLNNSGEDGNNQEEVPGGGVSQVSPTNPETPEATVNASPVTSIEASTAVVTPTPSPISTEMPTPQPTPTKTPELTPTPILTPEQKIEQEMPYKIYSKNTSTREQGAGPLESVSLCIDENVHIRANGCGADFDAATGGCPQIESFLFNKDVKDAPQRLAQAMKIVYRNALKAQGVNLTDQEIDDKIAAGTEPHLILPKAYKDNAVTLSDNVEVDLFNRPVYIVFENSFLGNLNSGVEGTGYRSFRVIDNSLVIEISRSAWGKNKSGRSYIAYNEVLNAFLNLSDYDLQLDPNKFANNPLERVYWEFANLNGKALENLLIPVLGASAESSTFLFDLQTG